MINKYFFNHDFIKINNVDYIAYNPFSGISILEKALQELMDQEDKLLLKIL